jgi:hypothetical protein
MTRGLANETDWKGRKRGREEDKGIKVYITAETSCLIFKRSLY